MEIAELLDEAPDGLRNAETEVEVVIALFEKIQSNEMDNPDDHKKVLNCILHHMALPNDFAAQQLLLCCQCIDDPTLFIEAFPEIAGEYTPLLQEAYDTFKELLDNDRTLLLPILACLRRLVLPPQMEITVTELSLRALQVLNEEDLPTLVRCILLSPKSGSTTDIVKAIRAEGGRVSSPIAVSMGLTAAQFFKSWPPLVDTYLQELRRVCTEYTLEHTSFAVFRSNSPHSGEKSRNLTILHGVDMSILLSLLHQDKRLLNQVVDIFVLALDVNPDRAMKELRIVISLMGTNSHTEEDGATATLGPLEKGTVSPIQLNFSAIAVLCDYLFETDHRMVSRSALATLPEMMCSFYEFFPTERSAVLTYLFSCCNGGTVGEHFMSSREVDDLSVSSVNLIQDDRELARQLLGARSLHCICSKFSETLSTYSHLISEVIQSCENFRIDMLASLAHICVRACRHNSGSGTFNLDMISPALLIFVRKQMFSSEATPVQLNGIMVAGQICKLLLSESTTSSGSSNGKLSLEAMNNVDTITDWLISLWQRQFDKKVSNQNRRGDGIAIVSAILQISGILWLQLPERIREKLLKCIFVNFFSSVPFLSMNSTERRQRDDDEIFEECAVLPQSVVKEVINLEECDFLRNVKTFSCYDYCLYLKASIFGSAPNSAFHTARDSDTEFCNLRPDEHEDDLNSTHLLELISRPFLEQTQSFLGQVLFLMRVLENDLCGEEMMEFLHRTQSKPVDPAIYRFHKGKGKLMASPSDAEEVPNSYPKWCDFFFGGISLPTECTDLMLLVSRRNRLPRKTLVDPNSQSLGNSCRQEKLTSVIEVMSKITSQEHDNVDDMDEEEFQSLVNSIDLEELIKTVVILYLACVYESHLIHSGTHQNFEGVSDKLSNRSSLLMCSNTYHLMWFIKLRFSVFESLKLLEDISSRSSISSGEQIGVTKSKKRAPQWSTLSHKKGAKRRKRESGPHSSFSSFNDNDRVDEDNEADKACHASRVISSALQRLRLPHLNSILDAIVVLPVTELCIQPLLFCSHLLLYHGKKILSCKGKEYSSMQELWQKTIRSQKSKYSGISSLLCGLPESTGLSANWELEGYSTTTYLEMVLKYGVIEVLLANLAKLTIFSNDCHLSTASWIRIGEEEKNAGKTLQFQCLLLYCTHVVIFGDILRFYRTRMEQEVSANGHDSNSTWHSLLSAISAGVRSGSSILFSSDAFSKLYDEHRIVSGHTASDTLLSCYQYFKLLLRTNHDENVALYLMEAIRTIITVDCISGMDDFSQSRLPSQSLLFLGMTYIYEVFAYTEHCDLFAALPFMTVTYFPFWERVPGKESRGKLGSHRVFDTESQTMVGLLGSTASPHLLSVSKMFGSCTGEREVLKLSNRKDTTKIQNGFVSQVKARWMTFGHASRSGNFFKYVLYILFSPLLRRGMVISETAHQDDGVKEDSLPLMVLNVLLWIHYKLLDDIEIVLAKDLPNKNLSVVDSRIVSPHIESNLEVLTQFLLSEGHTAIVGLWISLLGVDKWTNDRNDEPSYRGDFIVVLLACELQFLLRLSFLWFNYCSNNGFGKYSPFFSQGISSLLQTLLNVTVLCSSRVLEWGTGGSYGPSPTTERVFVLLQVLRDFVEKCLLICNSLENRKIEEKKAGAGHGSSRQQKRIGKGRRAKEYAIATKFRMQLAVLDQNCSEIEKIFRHGDTDFRISALEEYTVRSTETAGSIAPKETQNSMLPTTHPFPYFPQNIVDILSQNDVVRSEDFQERVGLSRSLSSQQNDNQLFSSCAKSFFTRLFYDENVNLAHCLANRVIDSDIFDPKFMEEKRVDLDNSCVRQLGDEEDINNCSDIDSLNDSEEVEDWDEEADFFKTIVVDYSAGHR